MLATTSQHRRSRPASDRAGPDRLEVAVLMGGPGPEHAVSLVSGREVAAGLERRGHRVHRVVLASEDEGPLDALPPTIDLVFIALHGEWGEDGGVQTALARRGLVYTGSGPEASARAFDKARTKRILAAAGVPLAAHLLLDFPFGPRDLLHVLRSVPSFPVVVKPIRSGSSVGVVVCPTRSHLRRALRDGARFLQPQLVEDFIPGHELTVGVLDGRALPLVEPVPASGHYDYRAKYDGSSGTRYLIEPEHLPAAVRARAREVALRAHQALGCSDFSRVDLRYDPIGERLAVLEVNTIPGMTPTSLLPKGAAAAGLSFDALVEQLCRLALRSAVR